MLLQTFSAGHCKALIDLSSLKDYTSLCGIILLNRLMTLMFIPSIIGSGGAEGKPGDHAPSPTLPFLQLPSLLLLLLLNTRKRQYACESCSLRTQLIITRIKIINHNFKLSVELLVTTSFGKLFQRVIVLTEKNLLRTFFWAWGLKSLKLCPLVTLDKFRLKNISGWRSTFPCMML